MKRLFKILIKCSLIAIIFAFYGCNSNARKYVFIHSYCSADTLGKGESLYDFYQQNLDYSHIKDSLIKRIVYPFTLRRRIGNSNDTHTEIYNKENCLSKSDPNYIAIIKLVRSCGNSKDFNNVFASTTTTNEVKTSFINSSNYLIYIHYISFNGRWYIKSVQESALSEDQTRGLTPD